MTRPNDLQDLLDALRGARTASNPDVLLRLALRIRIQARRSMGRGSTLRELMDSEDMAQDVLGHLVAHIDRFEGETWPEFLAFARAVGAQRIAGHARHAGRAKRRMPAGPTVDAADQVGATPQPVRVVAEREEHARIREAIEDLPGDLRRVVELRLQDVSYPEIAREMGSTAAAVRKRFSRALDALRQVCGL